MFEIDRTFCQRSNTTGLMEWYFNAREGLYGPYETKQIATRELKKFVERKKTAEDDGGRDSAKSKNKLALTSIEHAKLEPMIFDPTKRKKGIDE